MKKPTPTDLARSATAATRLLKALANRNRLLILCQLSENELRVQHLSRLVGLSPSALSQHLANLKRIGAVTARRDSRAVFYSIAAGPVQPLMKTLLQIYCAEPIARPSPHIKSRRQSASGT